MFYRNYSFGDDGSAPPKPQKIDGGWYFPKGSALPDGSTAGELGVTMGILPYPEGGGGGSASAIWTAVISGLILWALTRSVR